MKQARSYGLWGTLALICGGPALVGAKGCHCGSDEVPLGTNGGVLPDGGGPDSGNGGSGGSAGTGSGASGGSGGSGGGENGCYSPLQNFDTAYEPGSFGCACDDGELDRCIPSSSGRIALICRDGRWNAVEDGPCMPGAPPVPYEACGLPQYAGNCRNSGEERFWHNPATGQCEPFQFHCGGNQNNFLTEQACEQACEVREPGSACSTPPSDQGCAALQPAFYYDPQTSSCVAFNSGGCPTSPNIFYAAEECAAACDSNSVTAVIRPSNLPFGPGRLRCNGYGQQITNSQSGASFTLEGTILKRTERWGCGCARRPEFVMLYTYQYPNLDGPYLELRLCHDDLADPCEASCSNELSWDLADAFEAYGTTRFVFVD